MREIDIITTFSDSIVNIKSFEFKGLILYRLFLNYYVNEYYEKDYANFKSISAQKSEKKFRFRKIRKLFIGIWYILYLSILKFRKRFLYVDINGWEVDNNKQKYDLYNYNFINLLSLSKVLIIGNNVNQNNKIYCPKFVIDKLTILHYFLKIYLKLFPVEKNIVDFSKNLIEKNPNFVLPYLEIVNNIKIYYYNYLKWSLFLKILKPKYVITPDSGDLAMIAACKKLKISFIELQHGNITSEHFQYISTMPIIDKTYLYDSGLYADKVAVWGEYWKKVIIDGSLYPDYSIIIIGDYRFIPSSNCIISGEKKTILISTQWTVQKELIAYITFLSQNLNRSEYYIIIKPHPVENNLAYLHLEIPDFIHVSDKSVYELLSIATIHISVYSTLLFEAIKYPLTNYALYCDEFKNNIDEIIDSGVAQLLSLNELPVIKPRLNNNNDYFFKTFPAKDFIALLDK